MVVREIQENELDYIWEFEKENREYDEKILGEDCWEINEEEKKKWLNDLKNSYKDKNTKIFVVEEEGELLGYIWIHLYDIDNSSDKGGFVNEFFVTEKARGRKLATKLMNKAFEWFKQNNVKIVRLSVIAQNKNAIDIYKKFGFEPSNLYMNKKLE